MLSILLKLKSLNYSKNKMNLYPYILTRTNLRSILICYWIIIALVPTAKDNLNKKLKYPKFTIDNNDRINLKCFSVFKSVMHYLVYGVHVLYPKKF